MVIGLLDLASVALLLWIACDLLQIADSKFQHKPSEISHRAKVACAGSAGF